MKLKKYPLLFWLQAKRLLKRPGFLVILILVPIIALGVSLAAGQDSGALRIELCALDPDDPAALQAIRRLTAQKGVISYRVAASAEEARASVEKGSADAAWIFPEDMQARIEDFLFVNGRAFMEVIQREDSVALQLSREQLHSAVYPQISYEIYRAYVVDTFGEGDEEQIRLAYENAVTLDSMVVTETLNSSPVEEESSYLTVVLRGLLALVVLLSGLAASVFVLQDGEAGTFARMSKFRRLAPACFTVLSATLLASAAVFAALGFSSRLSANLLQEVLSLIGYAFAAGGFCFLLSAFFRRAARLGTLIPFVMIAALILSPIFFNLVALRPVQQFLPTYWYLYSAADASYLLPMLAYAFAAFAAGAMLRGMKRI